MQNPMNRYTNYEPDLFNFFEHFNRHTAFWKDNIKGIPKMRSNWQQHAKNREHIYRKILKHTVVLYDPDAYPATQHITQHKILHFVRKKVHTLIRG